MEYFTEQAPTHREVVDRIRLKYGENAKILTQKSVRIGGFLGLFGREGVEIAGYVSQESARPRKPDLDEEKRRILSTLKSEQTLQQLLADVQAIKSRVESDSGAARSAEPHPSIEKIETLLFENDFPRRFVAKIVERLKKDLTFEDLGDFRLVQTTVMGWIGEEVSVYRDAPRSAPRIVVLVGPTGVGKTTTIAKLAAAYGLGHKGAKAKSVRMLTIDNYRIGARNQIETYGEIMQIPVSCVETTLELKKKLALYQDVDLILIDTIGKSPKDFTKLAEMQELLAACGEEAEIYLTLSATTKACDVRELLQQFEPFKYRAVVLTKLDETMRVGNVIGALAERQKSLIFFTTGQVVPQDIERASVQALLRHLEGFKVNYEYLDQKFAKTAPKTSDFPAADWK